MTKKQFILLALAFGSALATIDPTSSHAQLARVEIHSFKSTTLTEMQFLVGEKNGHEVQIAGELHFQSSFLNGNR